MSSEILIKAMSPCLLTVLQNMVVGCRPFKRLLDNFHQFNSPYTSNGKFPKTTQHSAMSNGNSTNNLSEESGLVAGMKVRPSLLSLIENNPSKGQLFMWCKIWILKAQWY